MSLNVLINISLAGLLLSCSYCNKPMQNNENYILGDWIMESPDTKQASESVDFRLEFSFNADHTVDDKYGYFKRGRGPNQSLIFLGNYSKYKIDDKSLMIFDLGQGNIKKLTLRWQKQFGA